MAVLHLRVTRILTQDSKKPPGGSTWVIWHHCRRKSRIERVHTRCKIAKERIWCRYGAYKRAVWEDWAISAGTTKERTCHVNPRGKSTATHLL